MESQIDTNASLNLDDNLPKSREDFGHDLDQIIEKVILRVEKMYPKESIDKLFSDGKEQQARKMLAKAFGKFLAEVRHIAYNPITFCSPYSILAPSPYAKQKELCYELQRRKGYQKAFTDRYGINIEKEDLLALTRFLALSNETIKSPQLTDNFDNMITSESCPLPKQTLERLLGKEISPIPPKYKIETIRGYNQQIRYILKPKKEIEQIDIKQITEEESEGQAQPSTTEKKQEYQDNKTLEEAAAGMGAVGVTSFVTSGAAYLIENAEKTNDHKASITLASIGAALGLSAIATCIAAKFEAFKQPKTKIETYILDKKYELNTETFLGARVLIIDKGRGDSYGPPTRKLKDAERNFYHLKDAIEGTHEELPTMLPNKKDRDLYITTAISYLESHYNMMCEFPEIIAQRMQYKEDARDSRDIELCTLGYRGPKKAEFARY